jgi:D-sedoheptulose 7-phosphate isomerase
MFKTSDINAYFDCLSNTIARLPFDSVDVVADILVRAYVDSRMIYLFGNGGSAALASHFACDLGKGTINGTRKRFRVLALTDSVPIITAWANDANYEDIFAEQLANFAKPHDVAFAISGSGNSPNVLRGLRTAKELGATTVGLTGFSGGKLKDLCDVCVIIPSDNMQVIEDMHLCVAHAVFTTIRRRICRAEGVHA